MILSGFKRLEISHTNNLIISSSTWTQTNGCGIQILRNSNDYILSSVLIRRMFYFYSIWRHNYNRQTWQSIINYFFNSQVHHLQIQLAFLEKILVQTPMVQNLQKLCQMMTEKIFLQVIVNTFFFFLSSCHLQHISYQKIFS